MHFTSWVAWKKSNLSTAPAGRFNMTAANHCNHYKNFIRFRGLAVKSLSWRALESKYIPRLKKPNTVTLQHTQSPGNYKTKFPFIVTLLTFKKFYIYLSMLIHICIKYYSLGKSNTV